MVTKMNNSGEKRSSIKIKEIQLIKQSSIFHFFLQCRQIDANVRFPARSGGGGGGEELPYKSDGGDRRTF